MHTPCGLRRRMPCVRSGRSGMGRQSVVAGDSKSSCSHRGAPRPWAQASTKRGGPRASAYADMHAPATPHARSGPKDVWCQTLRPSGVFASSFGVPAVERLYAGKRVAPAVCSIAKTCRFPRERSWNREFSLQVRASIQSPQPPLCTPTARLVQCAISSSSPSSHMVFAQLQVACGPQALGKEGRVALGSLFAHLVPQAEPFGTVPEVLRIPTSALEVGPLGQSGGCRRDAIAVAMFGTLRAKLFSMAPR